MDKKKSTFIISLLAASLCMLCWGQAQGRILPREQAAAPTKTIPIDPELRTGTLDNSNENVADAAIAMRLDSEGNLVIHIKDYDQPPFGENWWDPGYDPDMFAFASAFTKAE